MSCDPQSITPPPHTQTERDSLEIFVTIYRYLLKISTTTYVYMSGRMQTGLIYLLKLIAV